MFLWSMVVGLLGIIRKLFSDRKLCTLSLKSCVYMITVILPLSALVIMALLLVIFCLICFKVCSCLLCVVFGWLLLYTCFSFLAVIMRKESCSLSSRSLIARSVSRIRFSHVELAGFWKLYCGPRSSSCCSSLVNFVG
jgi:hypothetical protein